MCELGFFPIFLENDLLKVDKILGLTFFFRQEKTSKDSFMTNKFESNYLQKFYVSSK